MHVNAQGRASYVPHGRPAIRKAAGLCFFPFHALFFFPFFAVALGMGYFLQTAFVDLTTTAHPAILLSVQAFVMRVAEVRVQAEMHALV